VALLPDDLAASARRCGAFVVPGKIRLPTDLLRLCLAYAVGSSFEAVARWARATGLADCTQETLVKRLPRCRFWLAYLIGQQLSLVEPGPAVPGLGHLRLLDATTIQRPGLTQPDRRLHVGFNLQTGCLDHLALTDASVGERLAAFPAEPGDLLVADRGYAAREGVAAVRAAEAHLLVRLPWRNGLPLQTPAGTRLDLLTRCRQVAPGTYHAEPVQTIGTQAIASVPGQLIIYALPPPQAAHARARVQRRKRQHSKACSPATREMAGYLILFTTLPATQCDAATACALYRLRWQIEIAFKRLKQVFGFHDVRARSDALCEMVILAKLLLALLAERLLAPALMDDDAERPFSPFASCGRSSPA